MSTLGPPPLFSVPGNGEEGGRTPPRSRSRAPAESRSPRFSQELMVASPPRKSHSESFVRQTRGPALGTVPTHGPWGLQARGPRGASRPPARTHALGPGTEKSRGGPSVLTTPPRSRSRAPATSRSPNFNQGPKVASPPRKSHSESFVHQIQAQDLARYPRTAPGCYKLADLRAPAVHQRGRTL